MKPIRVLIFALAAATGAPAVVAVTAKPSGENALSSPRATCSAAPAAFQKPESE